DSRSPVGGRGRGEGCRCLPCPLPERGNWGLGPSRGAADQTAARQSSFDLSGNMLNPLFQAAFARARVTRLATSKAASYSAALMTLAPATLAFRHRHLLGIEGFSPEEITLLLDTAENHVEPNRQADKKRALMRGRTIINLFFENSTRTRTSFELAGKRLGADVINMSISGSSIKKGETLIDTAMTLNAMHPDVLVVRHPESGAVQLLSEKVNCAVINAGDGSHEHPTQALLDALTIRRRKGRLTGLL